MDAFPLLQESPDGSDRREEFVRTVTQVPLPDLRRTPTLGPSIGYPFMMAFPTVIVVVSIVYTYLVDQLLVASPNSLQRMAGRAVLLVFYALVGLCLMAFFQCVSTDAGRIPVTWAMHRDHAAWRRRYCKKCGHWKPIRTHHCSICNRCCLNMDHHAPMFNNCVGFYSKKFFLQFFIYMYAVFLYVLATLIPGCAVALTRKSQWMNVIVLNVVLALAFSAGMLGLVTNFIKFHLNIVSHNRTTVENLEKDEDQDDEFDIGHRPNLRQVFGVTPALWWLPAHLQSSRPAGDGLSWPMRDGEISSFDAQSQALYAEPDVKVAVVGQTRSGKSHLVERYARGTLPADPAMTVGLEFDLKELELADGTRARLQIWDLGGAERYRKILELSAGAWQGVAGVLIVYDVTDRASFAACPSWMDLVAEAAAADTVRFLVGLKLDIALRDPEMRQVLEEEGREFAQAHGLQFWEASSVTCENVDEVFGALLREVGAHKPRGPAAPGGGLAACLGAGTTFRRCLGYAALAALIALLCSWVLLHGRGLARGEGAGRSHEGSGPECEDAFTLILQPERLQPFYLLPVTNGVKVMVTFLVFGYDLKFKPPCDPETCFQRLVVHGKEAGKWAFMFLLIFLSLNTYYVDIQQLVASDVNWTVRLLFIPVVLVTSPNYSACMAVWGSLAIQSPAAALRLKPKYRSLLKFGFPLVPCTATWLPTLKYVYAIVLLPYASFRVCAETTLGAVLLLFGCFRGAGCFLFGQGKAVCVALFFQTLVLATCGRWEWAMSHLISAAHGLRPLAYCLLMNVWGLLCPYLICLAYGTIKDMTMLDILEGMDEASSIGLLWPRPLNLKEAQAKRLAELNRTIYTADFHMDADASGSATQDVEGEGVEAAAENTPDPARGDGFNDTRVAIVFSTLQTLVPLMLEQMFAIIAARALMGSSAGDYYRSVLCTMTERQASRFGASMQEEALTSLAKTSRYADLLWSLL